MDTASLPYASLENEVLRVDYLTSLGPRIMGLYVKTVGVQLLAKTPDAHWPTPHGAYYLHGGHRLWTAPEDPFYTCPEKHVNIIAEQDGVTLRSNVDPAGLEKEISFHLDGNCIKLTHRVTWHGEEPIELAPWAITQMQLGGMAIMPQADLNSGLLPNRNLVLWPYSQLGDERLDLHDDLVLVHGQASQEAFKIGNYNPHGWIAYAMKNVLFIKRFSVEDVRSYPDMGCNAETYVKDSCVELETLGSLRILELNQSMTYEERWQVVPGEYPLTVEHARLIDKQLSPQ